MPHLAKTIKYGIIAFTLIGISIGIAIHTHLTEIWFMYSYFDLLPMSIGIVFLVLANNEYKKAREYIKELEKINDQEEIESIGK